MCSRLDAALYKRCHKDAERLSHAPEWAEPKSMHPNNGPLILPCLYRFMKENDSGHKVRPPDDDQKGL